MSVLIPLSYSLTLLLALPRWVVLRFDEKVKECAWNANVLIEPIAESKDKKQGTKTDYEIVHVEREEERDPEVEMMVKRRWTKEKNKPVMRCFYQNNPARIGYQKQMTAIWTEIGTSEITEQRLVGQGRVIRRNEWLTEVKQKHFHTQRWWKKPRSQWYPCDRGKNTKWKGPSGTQWDRDTCTCRN